MLSVRQISCEYDGKNVLDKLSFNVPEHGLSCLLGPSGCGKTTVLRAIAGFQPLRQGTITLADKLLSSNNFQCPPEQRRVGMVFQDFALFPHLTVGENIRFGIQHLSRREQRLQLNRLLQLIQLPDLANRYPDQLSGGQQQRVALARALAPNPDLLLLDEPFSSLDIELRRRLNLEVRDILLDYGISAILVTHDQEEAFAFADQIGLLAQGTLQQWDSPYRLYHEPQNRLVAEFIGRGSFLPGTVIDAHSIATELGTLTGQRRYPWPQGHPVEVLLRPDDVLLGQQQGHAATVVGKVFSGSATRYRLQLQSGHHIDCLMPSHHDHAIGDPVTVATDVEHLIAFASS